MKIAFLSNVFLLLICVACNSTPQSTPDIPSNTEKAIIEKNTRASLEIPKHHIPVQISLDGQPYVQLFDTTAQELSSNSPVYTCECNQDGSCKIERVMPTGGLACVPAQNGCKPDPTDVLATNAQDGCAFKKAAASRHLDQVTSLLLREYMHYNGPTDKKAMDFDQRGIRYPKHYVLELASEGQLKALYTLKNGQQVAELVPQTPEGLAGDPIRVTCACDCPDGGDCKMKVRSRNWIACEPQSSCTPKDNGDPCNGCDFKIVSTSLEDLATQIQEKQIFQD